MKIVSAETEPEIVIPKPGFSRPCFVVIKITPLPARDPYKAAADAPFNTDIDSISSGLISDRPLPISIEGFHISLLSAPVKLSIGTPSTTINGWFRPVTELLPRNWILEEPPAPLLERMICTPDTLPVKALAKLVSRACTKSSPFTSCMA